MRNLHELDFYRLRSPEVTEFYGGIGDETCGVFIIPSHVDFSLMQVVASSGMGWDHVSVSMQNRCPTWEEMDRVKRMFFERYETAIQFHVPEKCHINCHEYCLHLWRPLNFSIELPPPELVGPTG